MFRTIKKVWRLVFGVSFVAAGLSEMEATPGPGYVTIAIGVAFLVWHALHVYSERKK